VPVRSRFWGPFREEWYSICSIHMINYRENCRMCRAGRWSNVIVRKIGHWFYKHCPRLWRVWANRRWFNGDLDFLESHFPRLRRRKK
jgi:hypothetical protein